MRRSTVLAAGLLVVLGIPAAARDKGLTAFNAGLYDEAASEWNWRAQRGDPNAQYDLGLLWLNGLGSTPRNREQAAAWFSKAARQGQVQAMVELAKIQLNINQPDAALSWLNLAARWNDADAIVMLRSMGAPIPAADLYQSAQQVALIQQQRNAANQAQLGYALGCAVAGGCPQQIALQPVTPQPEQRAAPRQTIIRAPAQQPLMSQHMDGSWNHTCRYADGTEISSGKNLCPPTIAGRF
jgi:hypothetical protein